MKSSPDIRFQADSAKTAVAEMILIPMCLQVERAAYQTALREARGVVEQFQAELPQFAAKGGTLTLGDLARPQLQKVSELTFQQQSRDEVRLRLEFFLVLNLQQGRFWERAEIIAQAIDFVERFCTKPRDKQTIIYMETARFLDGNASPAP
jgi:hypothetical protein